MNKKGQWRLSPAFDVAYSYNPAGDWTSQHQMSLASKRNNFEYTDLLKFTASSGLKPEKAKTILDEITAAVANWKLHASNANVVKTDRDRIAKTHRLNLFKS